MLQPFPAEKIPTTGSICRSLYPSRLLLSRARAPSKPNKVARNCVNLDEKTRFFEGKTAGRNARADPAGFWGRKYAVPLLAVSYVSSANCPPTPRLRRGNFPSSRDGKLVRAPGVEPGSMASEATTLSIVLRSQKTHGPKDRIQGRGCELKPF